MKENLIFKLKKLFEKKLLIKRILLDLLFRVLSIVINFYIISYTYRTLHTDEYSKWLVILAVLQWIVVFEFGIGNSLRTKVPRLESESKYTEIDIYIVSSYILVFIIGCIILLLNILLSSFLEKGIAELSYLIILMLIILSFFSINKALALIEHYTYLNNLFFLMVNASFIIVLKCLSFLNFGLDLSLCVKLYLLVITFVYSIISYWCTKKLKYRFNISLVKNVILKHRKYLKKLILFSYNILLFQLAMALLYNSDTFIIKYFSNSKMVTDYFISYRAYSILTMIATIVLAPVWNLSSSAIISKDFSKIIKIIKYFALLFLLLILISLCSINFIDEVYKIWIDKSYVNKINQVFFVFYFILMIWNFFFSQILSGLEKFRFQSLTVFFAASIKILILITYFKFFSFDISIYFYLSYFFLIVIAISFPIKVIISLKSYGAKFERSNKFL